MGQKAAKQVGDFWIELAATDPVGEMIKVVEFLPVGSRSRLHAA